MDEVCGISVFLFFSEGDEINDDSNNNGKGIKIVAAVSVSTHSVQCIYLYFCRYIASYAGFCRLCMSVSISPQWL